MHNIVTLTGFALVKVTGDNAKDFLQNQFINDLQALSPGQLQRNAWCNRQGRVICNFLIVELAEARWIILPREMATVFITGLQRFVLRAAVNLSIVEAEPILGYATTSQLAGHKVQVPGAGAATLLDDILICQLTEIASTHYYLLFALTAAAAWSCPEKNVQPMSEDAWALFDIQRHMPWITEATSEKALPQELSFDKTNGMSLDKGCYPGQEIIARVHYRGKVKHRLYRLQAASIVTVSPGHCIMSEQQSIGTVINAASYAGKTELLAICRLPVPETMMLADMETPLHIIPEQTDQ